MNLVKRLLAKYLLLWLVATCVVAYFWPTLFGKDAPNPFLLTANGMSTLIFVTMTAVGSLLPFEEVKAVAKRWPKTLGGRRFSISQCRRWRFARRSCSAWRAERSSARSWPDAFRACRRRTS